MTNTLYSQLLKSLYAVHGIDGAFLGSLAEPIPAQFEKPTGTLARIPANVAADYVERIRWHEEAMEELTDEVLSDDPDRPWLEEVTDHNVDHPTGTVEIFWELEADLAELRRQLAAL